MKIVNSLRSIFLISLVLFLPLLTPTSSRAKVGAGTSRKVVSEEKNLEDIKSQLRKGARTLKGLEHKEGSILEELDAINKKINAVRLDLRKLSREITDTKRKINIAKGKLTRLRAEKRRLSIRLKKRLRAIYMIKSGAAAKALFTTTEGGDLGKRHKYISIIMDSDAKLIADVEENYRAIGAQKAKFDLLRKSKEKSYLSYKKKERSANKTKAKRNKFLRSTRRAKGRQSRLIKELENAASGLAKLIESLKKDSRAEHARPTGGFALSRGRLNRPVRGRVISSYGKVRHPQYKTVTFNNGIKISAKLGTEVRSIYDGEVAYVGWLRGYGLVMIMGHGDGFYSLFGHLLKVLKERGATVSKGEVVALVGDSGAKGVAGLYFELREAGVPRDPMGWFAERSR